MVSLSSFINKEQHVLPGSITFGLIFQTKWFPWVSSLLSVPLNKPPSDRSLILLYRVSSIQKTIIPYVAFIWKLSISIRAVLQESKTLRPVFVESVWLSCGTNWPCLTGCMYMLSGRLPRGVSPIYGAEVSPFQSNTVFSSHKQFTYCSLRQNITRTCKFPYAGNQPQRGSASKPECFTTQTRRRRELLNFSTSYFCFWTTETVGNRSTPDGFYLCNLAELPHVDEALSVSTENWECMPLLKIPVKYSLDKEDAFSWFLPRAIWTEIRWKVTIDVFFIDGDSMNILCWCF